MAGIDLNLLPDLQDVSRRLSFFEAAAASPDPSDRGRSNRESRFRLEDIPEEGEPTFGTPTAAASAPAGTSLALASPGLLQSQQPQAGVSAERMAEERRLMAEAQALFGEYQRQRQHQQAAEAALQLQQAWASAARLRSQEPMLYTVDGGAAGYETKWKELHPDSQRLLLQIEDKIREYRDDSEQLDQCSHLADLSLCNLRLEIYAGRITQEVESVSTIMRREYISIESLMTVIREIMRNTECAIRSYVKLRPRFIHTSAGSANSGFSYHPGSSGDQIGFSQLLARSPNFHYYSSATRRPSPFVQHTVARFEHHLGECCKWIPELEQLVQTKNDKTFAESLGSLSNAMSNVHDYLIHVASKVEHIHQYVETMKTEYLNDQRCWGDSSDPFLEANNREAAQQEAAARIIHPMLHPSPAGQPTTLVVVPMISNQLQKTPFPTVATSPSSYPTSSMRTSHAQLTNPSSSPGSVLQSIPFGSFSAFALGSTPAASLFGTGIPSSTSSPFPIPSGGIHHMLLDRTRKTI
ncbi:hypothetical protein U9M48_010664 [Paspalum notatum var. saurae]|uniref:Uncharacterized protein n=1 Tax=Paspalum notatum var. saurae TaxID=547442 RepID=A0AAQ3STL5_PASNO